MRYKYFPQLFTAAALAGALTLSAAPQADDRSYQDPELESSAVQQTTAVQTITSRSTMSGHRMRREIHTAISRDVTMSNRALNVRIICRDSQVILKGSVPTTMEKGKIEAKAVELAGSGNVIDQIKVTHPNDLG